MAATQELDSPRLRALQRALAAGNIAALEAFWDEVATQGAPLIEPLDGDKRHALVTFLWRATRPVESVAVFPESSLLGTDSADHAMDRLGDSDLWYKTATVQRDYRSTYQLAPDDPLTSRVVGTMEEWVARTAHWRPDPLNPRTFRVPYDEDYPLRPAAVSSVLALPDAPPQPWVAPRDGAPAGHIELHRLRSAILGNERRVWVYTTPGEASRTPPHLLLFFDGWAYRHLIPAPTVLDNLHAAGLLPPVVAVLVDSLDTTTRNRELPCHDPFVVFLADELLPWVRGQYRTATDPAGVVVAGRSFGGLAAAYATLRRPDLFGNVLAQSGGFRWTRDGEVEYEWLTRQYVVAPLLPLRFHLDIGLFEVETLGTGLNRLVANRHLRDVLRAKGYPVHYVEYCGGHEDVCWQGELADGLLALIGTEHNRRL